MKSPKKRRDPSACLKGRLLLADPAMRDPNFRRSVVYLSHHDNEGAHGFILNQPMNRTVGQFLDAKEFVPLAEVPVFKGGPVSPERLSFVKLGWDSTFDFFSFEPHLSTQEAAAAYLSGHDVRAFVGYSGWGSGQIEAELEEHAWIVEDAVPALAEPDRIADLWPRVLRGMGPYYDLLSRTPDRPERN